ncbi:MAG: ribonuclease P [Candidatus Nanoarchaeia archaeon]|nr:ribonuclease P [Candidatus Nanoarchaeia archaeon]
MYQDNKKIALERIKQLFQEADLIFKENPERANRYVHLARKIAMKLNLRFPRELKRKYCKHCYSYLKPGINCRIRNYKSRISIYCSNCKKFTRIPIKK